MENLPKVNIFVVRTSTKGFNYFSSGLWLAPLEHCQSHHTSELSLHLRNLSVDYTV